MLHLLIISHNYSKVSGSLWQYYKDIPAVNNAGKSNFWRTLEMPLINCEVELILDWSENCIIISTNVANQVHTFTIRNLYVPVVTLSTQDNAKLLPQLKSGFKRTISWNKYLAKPELLAQNANLFHLIEPCFQDE